MSKDENCRIIVAIDGPAGSGKSTVAKKVAKKIKLPYLDTGAMYRALTYLALCREYSLSDEKRIAELAKSSTIRIEVSPGKKQQKVVIDGLDVTQQIRTPELTRKVHYVASQNKVRDAMVGQQRKIARKAGGVIEGRDIGTVVFPKTPFKFYLDADFNIRCERRYRELKLKGVKASLASVKRDMKVRDKRDHGRKIGALKVADDAIVLDTTELTIQQVVGRIAKSVNHRVLEKMR